MTSRGGRGTKKPEAADAGAKRNVARTAEGKAARGRPKTKAPTETIHERSARLQREGNLPREVRPGEPLTVERQVNPYLLGPDVHGAEALNAIHALRGDRQLGAALSGRSIEALREMQTGSGAPGARNKADLISNIVSHVTGGRYSANFGASGAAKASGTRTASTSGPATRDSLVTRAASLASQIGRAHRAGDTAKRDRLMDDLEATIKQYRALPTNG